MIEPRPMIRLASIDDINSVLGVWQRGGAVPSVTDTLEDVERVIATTRSLLVAEVESQIVGTVIGGWDGWRGTISRLVVLPECRRSGIGRALVVAAHEQLRGLGATRVSALVVSTEPQAMDFWAAIGYSVDSRIARFVITLEGG